MFFLHSSPKTWVTPFYGKALISQTVSVHSQFSALALLQDCHRLKRTDCPVKPSDSPLKATPQLESSSGWAESTLPTGLIPGGFPNIQPYFSVVPWSTWLRQHHTLHYYTTAHTWVCPTSLIPALHTAWHTPGILNAYGSKWTEELKQLLS